VFTLALRVRVRARARVLEDEPPRASVVVNVRRAAGKPIPRTLLGQFPPSRGGLRKEVVAVMVRGKPCFARNEATTLKIR
jgi:hypothetical protein